MESARSELPRKPWLMGAGLAVTILAAATLALHVYAGRRYGYFVDELYYLACARHLAWGYVDQPPLIAAIAWIARAVLGNSLSALRFPAALASAGTVVFTGMLALELGGGRFAQGLAALCMVLAPGMLAMDHFLSMNAFEPLFWMGCAYLVMRVIRTGNAKLLAVVRRTRRVGLENKHSMAKPKIAIECLFSSPNPASTPNHSQSFAFPVRMTRITRYAQPIQNNGSNAFIERK